MAEEQLRYTIVFDKNTGKLTEVQSELGKTQSAAKETGAKGSEAFGQLQGKIAQFAAGAALAGLVLNSLKNAAAASGPIQELQATFDKTARTLVDALGPSIEKMSRGLQSVLVVIQGFGPMLQVFLNAWTGTLDRIFGGIASLGAALINLVSGDFRGAVENIKQAGREIGSVFEQNLVADFDKAWDKIVSSFSQAGDRINGKTRELTKQQVEIFAAEQQARQAHIDAQLALEEARTDRELQGEETRAERKREIVERQADRQIEASLAKQALEEETLNAQKEVALITTEQFEQRKSALRQAGADARAIIAQQETNRIAAIEAEQTKKLQELFKAQILAGAQAAAQKFQQTQNVGEALKAAYAAQIQNLANLAATEIAVHGARAAAAAFANAGGFPLGIPAAVATIAFYTSLAAAVSVAGGAVAQAISPPSGAGGGTSFSQAGGGGIGGGGGFGGGFEGSPALIGGTASPGAGGRDAIIINVSGADLLDNGRVARAIAEEIDRLKRD
jgi:hypothetical protein